MQPIENEQRRQANIDSSSELSALAKVVAKQWFEILRIPVSEQPDFSRAGGSSIDLVELQLRLLRDHSISLELAELPDPLTFDALVRAVVRIPEKHAQPIDSAESPHNIDVPLDGPASSAQIEQWIAEKVHPNSHEYLVPIRVGLPEGTTWSSLDAALVEVVNAHPSLRTSIHAINKATNSDFLQRIHPPLKSSGLVARSAASLEYDFPVFLRNIAVSLPSVESECKCRPVGLVADGGIESVLLIFHHAAVDDHSLNQIVRDLGNVLQGKPCAVEQCSLLEWSARAGRGSNADKEWWRHRLEKTAASLCLEVDAPEHCTSSVSEEVEDRLEPSAVTAIDLKLREHGVMRSAAAVGVLRDTLFELGLASGARVAIGTPMSVRDDPKVFETTGMFLNTVPLVVDRSADLSEVGRILWEAKRHRRVPYQDIVEMAQPTRGSDRSPWLDACIGIMESIESSMLPWKLLSPGETPFPILLMVKWTPDGLSLRCQVQSRFGGKTLARRIIDESASRLKALANDSSWIKTKVIPETDGGIRGGATSDRSDVDASPRGSSHESEARKPGRPSSESEPSTTSFAVRRLASKAGRTVDQEEPHPKTPVESEGLSAPPSSFNELFDLFPILGAFRLRPGRSLLESGIDSLAAIHLQAALSRENGVSMGFHEILASTPESILEAIGEDSTRTRSHSSPKRSAREPEGSEPSGESGWVPLNPIVKDVMTKDAVSSGEIFHLAWRIKDPRPWDEEQFVRRLKAVRQKWPSLRSRWSVTKGERVLAGDDAEPELTVFSRPPSEETQEHLLHHRIDLELTDPFRVAVWPCSEGGSEGLFVVHHIAADGVMAAEVIDELYSVSRYRSRTSVTAGEVRSNQAGSGGLDDLDWWIDQLSDRLEPGGLPRPENRSGRDAEQGFAARHDSTVAMTTEEVGGAVPHGRIAFGLAAWAIIVAARLGRDRVVIGLPFAMESRDGLSANMLPIVVNLADQTLSGVLESIRGQVADGIQHRNCSIGAIANRMSDGIGHLRPPVDAVLTIDDIHREVDGVSIRWQPMKYSAFQAAAVIPISKEKALYAVEAERGFLDGESTDSVLERWLHVISHLVSQAGGQSSQIKIETVPVMPPRMIKELEAFGGAEATLDPKQSVLQRFDRVLERDRDSTALTDGHQSLSYGELDAWSRAIGARLVKAGVRIGEPVAVVADRSAATTAAFLAVLRAGGWFVPIDPEIPEARRMEQVKTVGCTVALGMHGRTCFSGELSLRFIDIDDCRSDDQSKLDLPGDDARSVHGDSPMYGMFTSGTTGTPRCVLVPHRAVVRLVDDPFFIRLDPDSRMLNAAPLAFDASTIEIWGPLLNGGVVAIWTGHSGDLLGMAEFVAKTEANQCWLTTAVFNLMVDTFPDFFSPMSTVMTGGDVVSIDHVRRVMSEHPSLTIVNGYGPTENTVFTACEVMPPGSPPEGQSVSIGRPVRGTQIQIVDDQGRLLPRGAFGNLVVRGEGLALGYLEGSGVPEVIGGFSRFDATGGVEYRTGDYARWTAAGTLEFGGRKDSQVKLSGHRIELTAIEHAIRSEADVRDVCACIFDLGGRPVLVAAVVMHENVTLDEDALREDLERSMFAWEIPSRIVAVDEMPITANGKPDRRAIASLVTHALVASPKPARAKADELVRIVTAVAQKVTAQREIDPTAALRTQGLDSLDLLRLAVDLERALGRPVSLSDLLTDASVESIAAVIAGDFHREAEPLVILRSGSKDCRTGVYCIPGVGGTVFSFNRILGGLPSWCPVYGLPYPGISGDREPLRRVEDLADALVESSISMLPRCPVLVGYSFGGFVAFEVARRIIERGHEPVVMVIDAAPESLALYRGGLGTLRNWKLRLTNVLPESIAKLARHNSSFAMKQLRSVVAASFEAIRHYEPESLDVPVHLLRTSQTDFSPFDDIEDLGWRRLSSRVTVDHLPGRHLDVFRVASVDLAQKICDVVSSGRRVD